MRTTARFTHRKSYGKTCLREYKASFVRLDYKKDKKELEQENQLEGYVKSLLKKLSGDNTI